MEKELRQFLGEMYAKYGHNETTLALSKLVDEYDTQAMRERLEECKHMKLENQLQIQEI